MGAKEYLTLSELCDRWQIDRRTLYKLLPSLPVVIISARVRRVPLAAVLKYEKKEHLSTSESISSTTP